MSKEKTHEPIAIIGMHRSGTSLLARTLESAGLFVGWRQQPEHGEATYFQDLNDWILRQAGGTWDAPAPMTSIGVDPRVESLALDYLRLSVASPRAVSFLGPARYAKYRSLTRLPSPWGWKDPRTTLTLSIWRQIFPDLRAIHVVRNGVDVASSLTVRYGKMIEIAEDRYRRHRWRYRFRGRTATFADTPRVGTLEEALALWDDYTSLGHQHVDDMGDRAIELRYEDLLADPTTELERIAAFAGLDRSRAVSAADGLRTDRGLAYRNSPELMAFADRHSASLAAHGY